MEAPVVIGPDVGGTKSLSGLVDRLGSEADVLAEAGVVSAGLVAFEALAGAG